MDFNRILTDYWPMSWKKKLKISLFWPYVDSISKNKKKDYKIPVLTVPELALKTFWRPNSCRFYVLGQTMAPSKKKERKIPVLTVPELALKTLWRPNSCRFYDFVKPNRNQLNLAAGRSSLE